MAILRSSDLRFAHPHSQSHDSPAVEENTPKSIVLVDDEMPFTDLLVQMMGDYFDCPILTFSNPAAALKALPEINVGLLVTDYYMPRINGLDLIIKAGELGQTPPHSILITGHTFEDEVDMSATPHFKAMLPKPFRWQQLARLIEQHWPDKAGAPLRSGIASLHG